MNKTKTLKYMKKNKAKSALTAAGALLILVLVINGAMTMFSNNKHNYLTSNYGYDGYAGDYAQVESIERDYAEPAMAKSLSVSGSIVQDTAYYPPASPNEGIYDEQVDRKLIKNGNLSLVVKDIEVAQEDIQQITKNFRGFIQSSNFSENEQYSYYGNERRVSSVSKRGYFEIKIPTASFENALTNFKLIALTVNSESMSGSDVTEQYADLESQILNKKTEVEQYREIMKKAVKIEDVLKVTQYLNNAQSMLERLQGQMNRLSNQVELSTIRIDIVSEKDVEVFGVTWAPLAEVKQGFSSMVEDLRDFADDVIAFVFKLPVYILYIGGVVLALRIIWSIGKRLKRKVGGKTKKKK